MEFISVDFYKDDFNPLFTVKESSGEIKQINYYDMPEDRPDIFDRIVDDHIYYMYEYGI